MRISRMAKLCLLGCAFFAVAVADVAAATVTLTVASVKAASGQILATLCDDPKAPFPGSCRAYAAKAPALAGETVVTFHDVKPGTYALQVAHDENGNGRPDFPHEGFAFGNNMTFPPSFIGAAITVSGDTATQVRLVHMLANGAGGDGTSGVPAPAGVTKIDLRESGLYGELYLPAHTGPLPLLIAIGGSEGGLDIMSSYAVPFTRHGFAVLALAWWKEPGLPQTLENVSLEYFDRAIAWAKARQEIAADRIGFLGWSRGAEAALLVASRNPDLRAVIGIAPSAYVWKGLNFANPSESNPAWTVNDKPLPFVTPSLYRPGKPMAEMFTQSLAVAEARPETAIPVENIRAPILLLSGSDDRLWPSAVMAEKVMARLRSQHFAFDFEHKSYEGAGHSIFIGDPATTARVESGAMDNFMGGSAEANAAARVDSWQRIRQFLDKALKR